MKRSNEPPKNGVKRSVVKKINIEPICVTSFQWLIAPSITTVALLMQLFFFRVFDGLMLVNVPFWCFFVWNWYMRPNTLEEDVVYSVDYPTMSLFVQIWVVYGVAMQETPIISVYLVRLFSIFVLATVAYSFDDLRAIRTPIKKSIFISVIFSLFILLRSPDAAAHTSHPFIMLWRVMFYCATFILSDSQRKMGISVHIYSGRMIEASKMRDLQTLWILFCWQYTVVIGSIFELAYLIWQVWSIVLEKRQREEDESEV